MMSQGSFLENVASWSAEDCKRQLDEALPRLISLVKKTEDIAVTVGTLKTIVQSFLPHIPASQAETKVFSSILNKISLLFERILEDAVSQAAESVPEACTIISNNLTMAVDVLSYLECCVNHVCSQPSCEMSHIHTLPHPVLHVLKQAYQHCKDSSQVYGDILTTFADQLSTLFKSAHSLQMSFISLTDKLFITSHASEEDINDLSAICWGFFEITKIVVCLDVKIMVTSWKAINRLVNQHKNHLRSDLDIGQMVAALCCEVQTSYTYLYQLIPQENGQVSGGDKAFSRSVKVTGFQLKLLVSFVRDFSGYLSRECVQSLYSLLLHLHRPPKHPGDQKIPEMYLDEIKKQVINGSYPLTISLLTEPDFTHCVTCPVQDRGDYFPRCIIQVVVLEHLPKQAEEIQDRWIAPKLYREDEPRSGITEALFQSFPHCHAELCSGKYSMPGIMSGGKPQRECSFYEHACSRLCGFITSFPSRHFPILERCLLSNVLSPSMHCATLASDVWCFLSRYGTADLCRQHCCFLAKLTTQLPPNKSPQYCHLVSLLCRMLKFLAPEHQPEFVKQFPAAENLPLYSVLPLSVFSAALHQQLQEQLISSCEKVLHTWRIGASMMMQSIKDIVISVNCLINLFTRTTVPVALEKQMDIARIAMQILTTLPSAGGKQQYLISILTHSLLRLLSQQLSILQNSDILEIVKSAEKVLHSGAHDGTKLAIVEFLRCMGKHTLPPSYEQTQILEKLPHLFSRLLSDSNSVTHQMSLQAFASFAEETTHESVVPESLQNHQNIQDSVVNFLNQVTHPSDQSYSEMGELLSQSEHLKRHYCKSVSDLYIPVSAVTQQEVVNGCPENSSLFA